MVDTRRNRETFCRLAFLVILTLIYVTDSTGQQRLTATYPWPVTPFNASQRITGVFGEFRGPANAHFHNGTDIPKADGSPVYAVDPGVVTAIAPDGANAYIRIGNYAYVHIKPSPALSVGDYVEASQTVIGTILPGSGHVHLVDGVPGDRLNAIRPEGGLSPYVDPWPPKISDIRFYSQQTRERLATSEITGDIEITFRVREQNADPTTSEAGLNNGAYKVGYKILSADGTQEIFVPGTDGLVYIFDSIPSNSYVFNVYDVRQASTINNVYIITNTVTARSAWKTAQLPNGSYSVMVFAEDTRGNRTEVLVDVTVEQRNLIPPPQPTLDRIVFGPLGLEFAWSGGIDPDLVGFRLYESSDDENWSVHTGEEVLTADRTEFSESEIPPDPTYYRLTAVGTISLIESEPSDVYGFWKGPAHGGDNRVALVVDGFDRISGSWRETRHDFATIHERSLQTAGVGFETASNEAVEEGRVALEDYDAVIWFLGDEGPGNATFSDAEQALVKSYLESGGNFFVNGSEIAWDLSFGSSSGQEFLRNYLKVTLAGAGAGTNGAQGMTGGIFGGIATFSFGLFPYFEDSPDYFNAEPDAVPAMEYFNGLVAGVQYEGTFGMSGIPGKLVFLGFPFETIAFPGVRDEVMQRIMSFFFPGVVATEEDLPFRFRVDNPYPNPASESVVIPYATGTSGVLSVSVTDVLGRRVFVQETATVSVGEYELRLSTDRLTSGVYFVRLTAGDQSKTVRLVVRH